MKRTLNHLLAAALSLILALTPALAFALEMTVSSDKTSVESGGTVEVSVTVEGKDLAVAQGIFSYDPAILTFTEGEGGVSDGFINMISAEKDGSDSLSARIVFTASGSGDAKIDFTLEEVLDYDGDKQDTANASVTLSVSAPPQEPAAPPVVISYAKDGVAAQNVSGAAEQMYVWKSLENVTIPSRYSVTTLDYHGAQVEAAIVEDSTAPTLLYASNDTGETGSFYIYNAEADTLFPYRTLNSVSKSYIIMQPDGSVPLPDGFTETTLTVDDRPLTAWVSADNIHIVYARNPDGETGYYFYNPDDESLQRYSVLPAAPNQPALPQDESVPVIPDPAEESESQPDEGNGITLSRPIVFGAIGLMAVLIIAIVAMLISQAQEKARRRRRAEQRRAQRERERGEGV